MHTITRRGILAASAAVLASVNLLRRGLSQGTAPIALSAERRTLDIDGRAATVYGLAGPNGQGLVLDPGQRFRVDLTNRLDVPTIVHWHGQIPPNAQDGVPDIPMPMLGAGETRSYDFQPLPGTHWMHSHVPSQEMQLLAAPLIIRSPDDLEDGRQEVVLFLHDFSFRAPEAVLAEITGGHAGGHGAGHGAATGTNPETSPGMSGMNHGVGGMSGMAMDLNDHDWDAYLANDRTLADPDVIGVERGGRIRLRVINAAAATVFWIDTGATAARLVAVDGHRVEARAGTRFGIAMGQRIDLEIDLPVETGAWPVLALREGGRERTGLILATPGADIHRIASQGETAAPAFDLDLVQEASLVSRNPLSEQPVGRRHMVMLGGSMQPYAWTIDGRTWGNHLPIVARSGERVEIMFHNMSMMGHPMHLHGHAFQVVGVNGHQVMGARRDTVYVPPMSTVTVAFDAGEAARWMLHCHHMPHLATGMMTELSVTASV
ncbi:MAG: multicopper oxidase family protein [Azospirillaceae bacterium]